jgi:prepilin signal peptidase PulO-like enzyme (type II secretory pathway)
MSDRFFPLSLPIIILPVFHTPSSSGSFGAGSLAPHCRLCKLFFFIRYPLFLRYLMFLFFFSFLIFVLFLAHLFLLLLLFLLHIFLRSFSTSPFSFFPHLPSLHFLLLIPIFLLPVLIHKVLFSGAQRDNKVIPWSSTLLSEGDIS